MRVYFTDSTVTSFNNAVRWEGISDSWVELYDDQDNLIVVLNWKHVQMIEINSDMEFIRD